jgi:hypothetical protein
MRHRWIWVVGLLGLGACSSSYLEQRAAEHDAKAQKLRAKASDRNLAYQEKMQRLPQVPRL